MKKTLLSLSIATLLGSLAFQASASALTTFAPSISFTGKIEPKEQVVAIEITYRLAREAGERPRGADNEHPGDRQRRGGRG